MKVGYPRGRSLADGGGTVLYENVLANHGKLWDAKPGAEGCAPPGAALCSTGCSANRRKRRDAKPEAKGRGNAPYARSAAPQTDGNAGTQSLRLRGGGTRPMLVRLPELFASEIAKKGSNK